MEGHKPRKKWNTGKPEIYKKKREEKKFQDIGQEKFQDDSCVADLERYQIRWGQENQGLQEEALEIFFFNFKGTGTDNENVYWE